MTKEEDDASHEGMVVEEYDSDGNLKEKTPEDENKWEDEGEDDEAELNKCPWILIFKF